MFRVSQIFYQILLVLTVTGLFSGCIPNVQIPKVDQIHVAKGIQEGNIAADQHKEILLNQMYELMKANEGVEIPICTAEKDSKQCTKKGISVFVFGGIIPGVGQRKYYIFNEITLDAHQISFTKDNSSTSFIGTPVWTTSNKCHVTVEGGGLRVDMEKYYANWAVIGNMFMAEGWAIDYLNLNRGVIGLQLELDIKGYFTIGGGSRYVIFKFPNIPDSLIQSATQLNFLNRK